MALPFFGPVLATFVLALTIGETWPRNIAPGSGLKLAGLIATALTGVLVWRQGVRQVTDRRISRFAGVLCAVTALLGWPVWTIGLLPSANGGMLEHERATVMRLTVLTTTVPSRSDNTVHHWAVVEPIAPDSPIAGGRVFITEEAHRRWTANSPPSVTFYHAKGLLGAQVITGFD